MTFSLTALFILSINSLSVNCLGTHEAGWDCQNLASRLTYRVVKGQKGWGK
jgi:hypothetical protein